MRFWDRWQADSGLQAPLPDSRRRSGRYPHGRRRRENGLTVLFLPVSGDRRDRYPRDAKEIRKVQNQYATLRIHHIDNFVPSFK